MRHYIVYTHMHITDFTKMEDRPLRPVFFKDNSLGLVPVYARGSAEVLKLSTPERRLSKTLLKSNKRTNDERSLIYALNSVFGCLLKQRVCHK